MSQLPNSHYILETRNLVKSFGSFVAVNGLSLRVRPGTIHSLIGPNGAGKTTAFNLLTRFLQPTSGQIFYKGQDITHFGSARIAQHGMVRSFQISAVFAHMSAHENVLVALQRKKRCVYKFWLSESILKPLHEHADRLLDSVGLLADRGTLAGQLSYGRRRALEIATTLALEPEVMLLDEPTAGMGHEDVGRIADLIKSASAGRTTLMVEHNLSVVADLSDSITVLSRGQIVAEGSYAEVSGNPDVMSIYLGTTDV
ncbi:ABC transporter ATP-binding protein [Paraburkholderia xenovorans]|uniref:Amino acid/amide ABC transporter ATP-binding protein 1, HAAT family n=1 Tax=Paraburkholderia xenovorans (strain LB400) TaxID=266265 RepID=Q13GH6_PARXL|nr:ABC transporter ATP-binding protein [Paraburkholderia xenovorans]ABE36813.1 amino acid/amide ABC transporter ATP-binding protein 1, HAAT family [Paraburkholderia xenovorans LB400]